MNNILKQTLWVIAVVATTTAVCTMKFSQVSNKEMWIQDLQLQKQNLQLLLEHMETINKAEAENWAIHESTQTSKAIIQENIKNTKENIKKLEKSMWYLRDTIQNLK
mgnify:CR=1 FL=1